MSRVVGFAYAGARIQARYGRLVVATTWERLQRLDTLGGFLQAARDTPLRPWVAQLDAAADVHQIEAQLRALFRRRVAELAEWSPPPWRPAVTWAALLPDLPAVAARLRGVDAPWMQADSRLAAVGDDGRGRVPEELRVLQQAFRNRQPLLATWLERWRSLWPSTLPAERRGLEELARLLGDAVAGAARDAPAALAALHRPLRQLFRRRTRAPAGLFAYLALTWIEFAALRGAVVRRRLALPLEGAAAPDDGARGQA